MTAFTVGHSPPPTAAERAGLTRRVCADCRMNTWVPNDVADALWVVCAECVADGVRATRFGA